MTYPPDHIEELWQKIPTNLQPGMLAYMMEHRSTGGFLQAVFESDLALTVQRADQISKPAIPDIVQYILACAPAPCWGSKEKVDAWLKDNGTCICTRVCDCQNPTPKDGGVAGVSEECPDHNDNPSPNPSCRARVHWFE